MITSQKHGRKKPDVDYWKFFRYFLLFFVVQTTLASLIPPMISHDGYNYLLSGKSLFTSNFPYQYQLMREPGYPFLVWLAYQTPNVLLALTVMQNLFLSITAIIFFTIFIRRFRLNEKYTAGLLILGLFSVRGYSNTVLQICVIILVMSFFIFFILWLTENRERRKYLYFFSAIIGFTSASLNSALSCAIFGSLVLVLLRLHFNWSVGLKALFMLLCGMGVILIPWYSTIFPVNVNSQLIPSPHTAFELKYFERESFIKDNIIRIQSLGSLLFIYPDRAPGYPVGYSLPAKELMFFGNYWDYGNTGNCLVNQGGQDEVVALVSKDIKPRCIRSEILTAQRFLSRILAPIYLSSGFIFLASIFVSVIRKRKEMQLLLIPILMLMAIYGYGGAGISRFSAILPLLAPPLGLWLWEEIKKRKGKSLEI